MENDKQAKNSKEEEMNTETGQDIRKKDLTEINVAESKERKWKRQKKESRGGGF